MKKKGLIVTVSIILFYLITVASVFLIQQILNGKDDSKGTTQEITMELEESESIEEPTDAEQLENNLTYPANVLDYGADPTGHENSTEAIQEACRKNKEVYFPAGTYLIDRLTISGSVTLSGAGDNATFIKTTNLTDNVIVFKDDGWHVKDMKFDAVGNRTSGAYIYSSANYASIENVTFTRQYIGVDLDGSWSVNLSNITAFDGTPHEVAEGGAIIRLGKNAYTGPINIKGLTAKPTSSTLQPSSGIYMGYVDVVSISDALIIWHKKDVVIAPKGRQFAALVEITNSCFDTAENGIYIEPTKGARVLRCGITNTWFGAHSSDSAVINGSDGVITGLQFTNAMFLCNAGNGVRVSGEGVDGIYFSNSFSGGNQGSGLILTDGAQNVVWNGGVLGACHELNGNVQYGYCVEEGCSASIYLTDLRGNSTGVCLDDGNSVTVYGNTEE
ncbi:MAG: right-handed parallel beta-helix repeat-containing protein [Roseburia sp.]|nr:right-handed parallel beta-helix repeat-containing protein [Roseburia sp.]